jgi:UPF0148 protein
MRTPRLQVRARARFEGVSQVSESTKQMAELLRSGARMLSHSCPECGSPLFQLKTGEIWCASCQRRVVIVPEGEEAMAEAEIQLEPLERALLQKVSSMTGLLAGQNKPGELRETAEALNALLASLERLRRIRKG